MLSNQSNIFEPGQSFAPDQTVQTNADGGKWMLLAEASAVLGVSEKTLRRYIKQRRIKYRRIGKQTNSPLQVLITDAVKESAQQDVTDNVVDIVDAETGFVDETESFFTATTEEPAANAGGAEALFGKLLSEVTEQFSSKLAQQTEVLLELRHELQEKDRQLRLLPDLQKQIEDKEKNSDFEKVALEKQVAALKAENEALKQRSWWQKIFGDKSST
jgi:hypothetical protein